MVLRNKKTILLQYGDTGKEVEKAQKLLQKAGSTIQVNGVFSIGMTSAVKAFQKRSGLKITGVIDDRTWEKLNEKKPGGRKK